MLSSDARVLQPIDTSDLDPLLLDVKGRLKAVPAEVYANIKPWDKLRMWAHQHAVYGLPTTELVEYIQNLIANRSAIEIGSGSGCLGRSLGIPLTDNWCQTKPEVAMLYALQRQPTIKYEPDVENIDALAAIAKYRPSVVVASWFTQWSDGSRPGSMYGVVEEDLLDNYGVETYMVFGSLSTHGGKSIRSRPHRVIQEPWMWSRAKVGDTALFVWG